ncbi:hypothetical protein ACE1CD_35340 [Aerosakkonema sp. BLCC-F183]|uniref:hypothetical protein n=1 Tax=Aerosakkonema sp. BLCC-F183 TaxID=3342834 RepID=UPI0035B84100
MDYLKLLKEKVNLLVLNSSIIMVVVGFGFLCVSAQKDWGENWKIPQNLIQNLGGAIFTAGALSFVWDMAAKRAFLDEVLAKVNLSQEFQKAGIVKITEWDNITSLNWKAYFEGVRELDIFFTYGRTWSRTYTSELKELASKKEVCIRLVLPDNNDPFVLGELSRLFCIEEKELKKRIEETADFFQNLRKPNGAKIDVYFCEGIPFFSFYRFNDIAVVAMVTHRRERGVKIPTFVCEKGGTIYNYIREDFEDMIKRAKPAAIPRQP